MQSILANKTIIIEGVDRVGKSSLRKALKQKSDFSSVVHDRAELSIIVYALIYKRNYIDIYPLIEKLKVNTDVKIFLYCSDIKTLEKRAYDTLHESVNFERDQNIFKNVISINNLQFMQIDVYNKTIEQIILEIENNLENNY